MCVCVCVCVCVRACVCVWERLLVCIITLYSWEPHDKFRAKEGSGIRLITHQSSCEFSAAVGHWRERERTEDNSGREWICWAALKAPFSGTEHFPLPASLSCSLSTEQPNHCRLFSGEGGADKSLSLSLPVNTFFHPSHSFSLSTALLCSLCYASFPSLHIFSTVLLPVLSVSLSVWMWVWICMCLYKWLYSFPQTKPDMYKNVNLICMSLLVRWHPFIPNQYSQMAVTGYTAYNQPKQHFLQ